MKKTLSFLILAFVVFEFSGLTFFSTIIQKTDRLKEGWKCGMKLCLCDHKKSGGVHDHSHHHHHDSKQVSKSGHHECEHHLKMWGKLLPRPVYPLPEYEVKTKSELIDRFSSQFSFGVSNFVFMSFISKKLLFDKRLYPPPQIFSLSFTF